MSMINLDVCDLISMHCDYLSLLEFVVDSFTSIKYSSEMKDSDFIKAFSYVIANGKQAISHLEEEKQNNNVFDFIYDDHISEINGQVERIKKFLDECLENYYKNH